MRGKLLRYLREELATVFATTSSDSVLPQIMAKLRRMGICDSTVGLVIPTGYSFNLDAFSIYITLAAVFIAQATNTPISMADLLTILAIALVTSKGAHGVPGSAIVVLAATLHAIPAIPAIGLVLSVDWFMGIARAGQPDRQLRGHGGHRRVGRRHRPRTRLAQKLEPGERLGEQALAENFSVSRTMVREALMQLQARGFVEVQSRRGWYVVQPSAEEARDAFSARRIVEAGILAASEGRPLAKVIRKLRDHIADEQRAIEGADAATRAFLLADFHVCLAAQMGHRLLVDVLRDLTARTTLAATLYQSKHEAGQSCAEHGAIVAALEAGDMDKARQLMLDHIGNVERALEADTAAEPDAPSRLRTTLAPVALPGSRR